MMLYHLHMFLTMLHVIGVKIVASYFLVLIFFTVFLICPRFRKTFIIEESTKLGKYSFERLSISTSI
jgi:hypothetical protein